MFSKMDRAPNSVPTDVFMVSEADKRPMTQSSDHASQGDKRVRRGDVYRHRIGAVPLQIHPRMLQWLVRLSAVF